MTAATTAPWIEAYQVKAYKGTSQGATFEKLLCIAESLGTDAVFST